MSEEELWNKFADSGRIDDYLRYINKKGTENDNT